MSGWELAKGLAFLSFLPASVGKNERNDEDGGHSRRKAVKRSLPDYHTSAGTCRSVTGVSSNKCCSMMVLTSDFFTLPYMTLSG